MFKVGDKVLIRGHHSRQFTVDKVYERNIYIKELSAWCNHIYCTLVQGDFCDLRGAMDQGDIMYLDSGLGAVGIKNQLVNLCVKPLTAEEELKSAELMHTCSKCGMTRLDIVSGKEHKCFPFEIGNVIIAAQPKNPLTKGHLYTVIKFENGRMFLARENAVFSTTVEASKMYDLYKPENMFKAGDLVINRRGTNPKALGKIYEVIGVLEKGIRVECLGSKRIFFVDTPNIFDLVDAPIECKEKQLDKDTEFWQRANDYWKKQNDTLDPHTGGPKMKQCMQKEHELENFIEAEKLFKFIKKDRDSLAKQSVIANYQKFIRR